MHFCITRIVYQSKHFTLCCYSQQIYRHPKQCPVSSLSVGGHQEQLRRRRATGQSHVPRRPHRVRLWAGHPRELGGTSRH